VDGEIYRSTALLMIPAVIHKKAPVQAWLPSRTANTSLA